MADSVSIKKKPTVPPVISLVDSVKNEQEPVPSEELVQLRQENVDLRQQLDKKEKTLQSAIQIAGTKQAHEEFLEKLIDSKPNVKAEDGEKAELRKKNDAQKRDLEAADRIRQRDAERIEKLTRDFEAEREGRARDSQRILELEKLLHEKRHSEQQESGGNGVDVPESEAGLDANSGDLMGGGAPMDVDNIDGGEVTPETNEEETRGRQLSRANRGKRRADSTEDSDGSKTVKKTAQTPQAVAKKRSSIGRSANTPSSSKNSRVTSSSKRRGTEMECPECEFRTMSVNSWVAHLRRIHSTTPFLAGVALQCECGKTCLSDSHSRSCNISNFSVIRTRGGPIRRLDDEKETPQCVQCESYPKTTVAYTRHLLTHQKSTLKANGVYLKCECAFEVTTANVAVDHKKECDGRVFTLHKLDEE